MCKLRLFLWTWNFRNLTGVGKSSSLVSLQLIPRIAVFSLSGLRFLVKVLTSLFIFRLVYRMALESTAVGEALMVNINGSFRTCRCDFEHLCAEQQHWPVQHRHFQPLPAESISSKFSCKYFPKHPWVTNQRGSSTQTFTVRFLAYNKVSLWVLNRLTSSTLCVTDQLLSGSVPGLFSVILTDRT